MTRAPALGTARIHTIILEKLQGIVFVAPLAPEIITDGEAMATAENSTLRKSQIRLESLSTDYRERNSAPGNNDIADITVTLQVVVPSNLVTTLGWSHWYSLVDAISGEFLSTSELHTPSETLVDFNTAGIVQDPLTDSVGGITGLLEITGVAQSFGTGGP